MIVTNNILKYKLIWINVCKINKAKDNKVCEQL